MEIVIRPVSTGAALDLIQHKFDVGMAGDIGPGWEYYLDNLVASREGKELPKFTDYHPSQSAYFTAQIVEKVEDLN
jgi:hypothetical protein